MSRPADARVSALYQEIILDHFRHPRSKGALEGADARASMHHPLCGDELEVELALDGDRVADIRFSGRGCSISQASASMMTEAVRGRSRAEIAVMLKQVSAMLRGADLADDAPAGDLRALSGVARFPVRVKCATMAWEALSRALAARPAGGA